MSGGKTGEKRVYTTYEASPLGSILLEMERRLKELEIKFKKTDERSSNLCNQMGELFKKFNEFFKQGTEGREISGLSMLRMGKFVKFNLPDIIKGIFKDLKETNKVEILEVFLESLVNLTSDSSSLPALLSFLRPSALNFETPRISPFKLHLNAISDEDYTYMIDQGDGPEELNASQLFLDNRNNLEIGFAAALVVYCNMNSNNHEVLNTLKKHQEKITPIITKGFLSKFEIIDQDTGKRKSLVDESMLEKILIEHALVGQFITYESDRLAKEQLELFNTHLEKCENEKDFFLCLTALKAKKQEILELKNKRLQDYESQTLSFLSGDLFRDQFTSSDLLDKKLPLLTTNNEGVLDVIETLSNNLNQFYHEAEGRIKGEISFVIENYYLEKNNEIENQFKKIAEVNFNPPHIELTEDFDENLAHLDAAIIKLKNNQPFLSQIKNDLLRLKKEAFSTEVPPELQNILLAEKVAELSTGSRKLPFDTMLAQVDAAHKENQSKIRAYELAIEQIQRQKTLQSFNKDSLIDLLDLKKNELKEVNQKKEEFEKVVSEWEILLKTDLGKLENNDFEKIVEKEDPELKDMIFDSDLLFTESSFEEEIDLSSKEAESTQDSSISPEISLDFTTYQERIEDLNQVHSELIKQTESTIDTLRLTIQKLSALDFTTIKIEELTELFNLSPATSLRNITALKGVLTLFTSNKTNLLPTPSQDAQYKSDLLQIEKLEKIRQLINIINPENATKILKIIKQDKGLKELLPRHELEELKSRPKPIIVENGLQTLVWLMYSDTKKLALWNDEIDTSFGSITRNDQLLVSQTKDLEEKLDLYLKQAKESKEQHESRLEQIAILEDTIVKLLPNLDSLARSKGEIDLSIKKAVSVSPNELQKLNDQSEQLELDIVIFEKIIESINDSQGIDKILDDNPLENLSHELYLEHIKNLFTHFEGVVSSLNYLKTVIQSTDNAEYKQLFTKIIQLQKGTCERILTEADLHCTKNLDGILNELGEEDLTLDKLSSTLHAYKDLSLEINQDFLPLVALKRNLNSLTVESDQGMSSNDNPLQSKLDEVEDKFIEIFNRKMKYYFDMNQNLQNYLTHFKMEESASNLVSNQELIDTVKSEATLLRNEFNINLAKLESLNDSLTEFNTTSELSSVEDLKAKMAQLNSKIEQHELILSDQNLIKSSRGKLKTDYTEELDTYLKNRNNRYYIKDVITNKDKVKREIFIGEIKERLQNFEKDVGTRDDLIKKIQDGKSEFKGLGLQPILNRLILDLKPKLVVVEDFEESREDIPSTSATVDEKKALESIKNNKKLYEPLNLMYKEVLKLSKYSKTIEGIDGEKAQELAEKLNDKMKDYIIKIYSHVSKKKEINQKIVKDFNDDFKVLLHSQDDLMDRHRGFFGPFVKNFFGFLLTCGLAIVGQLVGTKIKHGYASFFGEAKGLSIIKEIDQNLNDLQKEIKMVAPSA